jgi:hypothetical protein
VYERQPVVIDGWMALWFVVAAIPCIVAIVVPMGIALRKMESFEF